MGKSSRRRRRTTCCGTATTTTTVVLSAAAAISITATMNNIQVCNSQYDDPAAAPSLHHHHHQVVDDDGVNHDNNNNDNNLSISISTIIPPSSHTLSTVFTCGQPNDWRSSQSCSTLCPSGLDSDCPDGTVCYAGIPCLLAAGGYGEVSEDDNEQFMNIKLEEQTALEKRQMERHQRYRQHETSTSMIDKFVCGTSYEQATTSCATRNQLTTQGTLHPFATKAIYCPSGGGGGSSSSSWNSSSRNNKECPHAMECYIVSCPRELDGTKSSTLGQYVFDTNDNIKLVVEDVTSWVIDWSQEWYNTMMERWDDDDDLEEDDESGSRSRLTIWNEWKRSFRDGNFLVFSSSSSSSTAGLN